MIHCRVQHYPARADLIPELLRRLEPLPTEVIAHSSDPPSPWGGYQLCLTDIPDCTHLLIVQDDTVPVPNFATAIRRVASRHPETPVCLFLSKQPAGTVARAKRAISRGECYTPLYPAPFVPLVGCLWPKAKAEEFLEWTKENRAFPKDPNPRADDSVAAIWMKRTRQHFMVTVPSLVEHLGVPSVKGSTTVEGWKALFLAEDALAYDW